MGKSHFAVFIANFKRISHIILVFLLLTWNKYMVAGLTDDKIETGSYANSTKNQQHLQLSTCHPYHCKKSIAYSQFE